MAARRKKTWKEKLADNKGLPRVVVIAPEQEKRWGKGRMVIPAPMEVDRLIRTIRKGRTATINDLRTALVKKHGTDLACPITTGIFAWIAAHAAAEEETEGGGRVTPWWRVLKQGGRLNPKFPGGLAEQRRRLKLEGHVIRGDRVVAK